MHPVVFQTNDGFLYVDCFPVLSSRPKVINIGVLGHGIQILHFLSVPCLAKSAYVLGCLKCGWECLDGVCGCQKVSGSYLGVSGTGRCLGSRDVI